MSIIIVGIGNADFSGRFDRSVHKKEFLNVLIKPSHRLLLLICDDARDLNMMGMC